MSPSYPTSAVLIPEDVIKEFIIPNIYHLQSIDKVVQRITLQGEENINQILYDSLKYCEESAIAYLLSNYEHLLSPGIIHTAFIEACYDGLLKKVHYMLSLRYSDGLYILDPASEHNLAIRVAAKQGHLHIVKYFCSLPNCEDHYDNNNNDDDSYNDGNQTTYCWCDPSDDNNWALRWAAYNGHLHVVKYLCELQDNHGAFICDPSDNNHEAIRWAAFAGHLDVVQYLYELRTEDGSHICDPSAENNEAIQLAVAAGHLHIVKYLCELRHDDGYYICDPSEYNNAAVQWATHEGHRDILQYLLLQVIAN